jgi:hypothetical protein
VVRVETTTGEDMSRTWTRTALATHCGFCGELIAVDAPIEVITLPTIQKSKIRGVCCADGKPPDNLPQLPPPTKKEPPMTGIDKLAADFKMAQAHDDDWEDLL